MTQIQLWALLTADLLLRESQMAQVKVLSDAQEKTIGDTGNLAISLFNHFYILHNRIHQYYQDYYYCSCQKFK